MGPINRSLGGNSSRGYSKFGIEVCKKRLVFSNSFLTKLLPEAGNPILFRIFSPYFCTSLNSNLLKSQRKILFLHFDKRDFPGNNPSPNGGMFFQGIFNGSTNIRTLGML